MYAHQELSPPAEAPLLSEMEADVIREIFNIGIGRAAGALSEMVDGEILLSVPALRFMAREEAAATLTGGARTVCAVKQGFESAFGRGNAVLMFPEEKSLDLVRILTGEEPAFEDMTDLEQEALTEVGNIILNACLGTLGNILGRVFDIDLPRFARGSLGTVLTKLGAEVEVDQDLVLVLVIRFGIADAAMDGQLAFLLDMQSIRSFAQRAMETMA